MIFGVDQKKGLILEGATFKVIKIGKNYNTEGIFKYLPGIPIYTYMSNSYQEKSKKTQKWEKSKKSFSASK